MRRGQEKNFSRRGEEQGRRGREEQGIRGRGHERTEDNIERRREGSVRREEMSREERGRAGRTSGERANFLEIANMIREEVQKAFFTFLPPAGANGSVRGPLGPRAPPVMQVPSWAEVFSRATQN